MSDTIIDKIYSDYSILLNYLESNKEISLRNDADNNFKKVLLLSIASFFEYEIREILLEFINKNSNGNEMMSSFAKNQGVHREYHKYFDWRSKNVNSFLGLFGEDFRKDVDREIKSNEVLQNSVKDFLEIGLIRNELVHENFASFSLDKTAKEIYNLYSSAILFVNYLNKKFSS